MIEREPGLAGGNPVGGVALLSVAAFFSTMVTPNCFARSYAAFVTIADGSTVIDFCLFLAASSTVCSDIKTFFANFNY
jgi:hypothetical protein